MTRTLEAMREVRSCDACGPAWACVGRYDFVRILSDTAPTQAITLHKIARQQRPA